jgi:hypothetical protein
MAPAIVIHKKSKISIPLRQKSYRSPAVHAAAFYLGERSQISMSIIDATAHAHPDRPTAAGDSPEKRKPAKPITEARLRANRQNAKKSTGPRTETGKQCSSLNATRHGILSQVIHLPEEGMKAYDEFTRNYLESLSPIGAVEIQLANACADLQFRLHRFAAGEHNLFAIGHDENGSRWNTGHPESHTALTFVETVRRSKDPLATITLYESRLSRRFLQTLRQLREIQAERRAAEQQQLAEMYRIAAQHPETENLNPAELGFVCSVQDWKFFYRRNALLNTPRRGANRINKTIDSRQLKVKVA